VHLRPTPEGIDIALRIDGVLQSCGTFPRGKVSDVVTRLKVLSDLLTYKTDVPQEGRVRNPPFEAEIRVSSFPTLHGEQAVVRLFAAEAKFQFLENLGLPADVYERLKQLIAETSGAILITGPAGSGKTTTAYACLPEVIFVGEMRDPVTAGIAMQASLTGQLVLTTFHAGSAAGAVSRLLDMGLEPYILRSGLLAGLCQRLVRKLCSCATQSTALEARLGLPLASAPIPRGCPQCHGTGYQGRTLLVEMLTLETDGVGTGILGRWDADQLERAAVAGGMRTRWACACAAVEAGLTSAAEIRRVLGFSDAFSAQTR
jgi:type II secretory ATPase GspE/PulE/Tfp pilus assembly ATPase PilB-like protein